jgi:hypothetical protein
MSLFPLLSYIQFHFTYICLMNRCNGFPHNELQMFWKFFRPTKMHLFHPMVNTLGTFVCLSLPSACMLVRGGGKEELITSNYDLDLLRVASTSIVCLLPSIQAR